MAVDNNTFIPWGMHPIKDWVIGELKKRAKDYGFSGYTAASNVQSRSGVHTSWMRVFSNGIPTDDQGNNKDGGLSGFAMNGVHGFSDSYGFNNENKQVLGYDAKGVPHKLDNSIGSIKSSPHRPPPSVESIDVELMGGQNSTFSGLCRKATIKWKCYSLDQLNYMTPYFLSPKVSCVIEWGWDNYNPASLIDLVDVDKLRTLFGKMGEVMQKIYASKGNYDCLTGIITDYDFTMNAQGAYECTTVVSSVAWLFEGTDYQNQSAEKTDENGTTTQIKQFKEFIKNHELGQDPKAGSSAPKVNGRYFRSNNRQNNDLGSRMWIRFDYFIDVINYFFAKNLNKIDLHRFNIDDVLISAHPGIKSIDVNILVPNKIAPQYLPKGKEKKESKKFIEGTTEYKLFKDAVLPSIQKGNLAETYDDLYTLLNQQASKFPEASGNPFPVLSPIPTPTGKGTFSAGYSGYLKDIYVSVEMINEEVESCRTAKDLVESITKKISSALSGMVDLRIEPDANDSNSLTILDKKFTPLYDSVENTLPVIVVGDLENAYLTNFSLGVKMSQEMANQTLFETGKKELKPDVKTKSDVSGFGRFVMNDRLWDGKKATTDAKDASTQDSTNKTNVTQDKPGAKYIDNDVEYYVTVDSDLIHKVLFEDASPKAVYLNSAIMPGSTCELEMMGISGFTYLGQFVLRNVPRQYSETNAVWQISNIKQSIEKSQWKTTVTSQVRPMSFLRRNRS